MLPKQIIFAKKIQNAYIKKKQKKQKTKTESKQNLFQDKIFTSFTIKYNSFITSPERAVLR